MDFIKFEKNWIRDLNDHQLPNSFVFNYITKIIILNQIHYLPRQNYSRNSWYEQVFFITIIFEIIYTKIINRNVCLDMKISFCFYQTSLLDKNI